jgi:hypothetical protein
MTRWFVASGAILLLVSFCFAFYAVNGPTARNLWESAVVSVGFAVSAGLCNLAAAICHKHGS